MRDHINLIDYEISNIKFTDDSKLLYVGEKESLYQFDVEKKIFRKKFKLKNMLSILKEYILYHKTQKIIFSIKFISKL